MLAMILFVSLSGSQAATQARAPEASPPPPPNPNRQICRSRPIVGSRIAQQRICRTAAEWAIYDNDLEQSRRDLADRGARGCDVSQRTGTAVGQC